MNVSVLGAEDTSYSLLQHNVEYADATKLLMALL